jgi:hypothetical protein
MPGKMDVVVKLQVVTKIAGYPQIEVNSVHFFIELMTTISLMAHASLQIAATCRSLHLDEMIGRMELGLITYCMRVILRSLIF